MLESIPIIIPSLEWIAPALVCSAGLSNHEEKKQIQY